MIHLFCIICVYIYKPSYPSMFVILFIHLVASSHGSYGDGLLHSLVVTDPTHTKLPEGARTSYKMEISQKMPNIPNASPYHQTAYTNQGNETCNPWDEKRDAHAELNSAYHKNLFAHWDFDGFY